MLSLGTLLAALVVVGANQAPDPYRLLPLPRTGDQVEWYVVKAGDTLDAITERLLGDARLWRENHRLNPQVQNPHLLRIGQRLRVITYRPPEERKAEVTQVSRRVDKQLYPDVEELAEVGDELKEKDGLRTFRNASAELTFDDTSRLVVGENSQIFLKRVDANLVGVKRESIEILSGQAEMDSRPKRAGSRQIEILMGGTRATPQPDRTGRSQTRARRAEEGAQVMVYSGVSQVVAAGAAVEVPRGMGTSVVEGQKPKPPEPLLPAPEPIAPARRSSWGYANPRFSWQPVPEALLYVVEVCRDPECTALLLRADDLREVQWQPEQLPVGDLYWRVTAVSRSALDGYPSRPLPFSILSEQLDLDPPTVAVAVHGPGQVTAADAVQLGPGGELWLEAHDDASGLAEVRYRWDGGSWQRWRRGALSLPDQPGTFHLELQADDELGRSSAIWPVTVTLDREMPAPPAVTWSGP